MGYEKIPKPFCQIERKKSQGEIEETWNWHVFKLIMLVGKSVECLSHLEDENKKTNRKDKKKDEPNLQL